MRSKILLLTKILCEKLYNVMPVVKTINNIINLNLRLNIFEVKTK